VAYYYQDPNHGGNEHKYANYSNHGNSNYGYEDDSYLDHSEPNQCEPNHTHSEPNHYIHEHNDHRFEHKVAQHETAGEDHKHRELIHDDEETGIDWEAEYEGEVEGYKHRELKYEGDKGDEHRELKYKEDKAYEHETLKSRTNGVYELRELNCQAQEPRQLEFELNHKLGHIETDSRTHAPYTVLADKHNGDDNVYGFAHTSDHAAEPCIDCPTNVYKSTLPAPPLYTPNNKPQRPWCNSNEALELQELEKMYEKWGHEPPTALYDTYSHAIDPTNTYTPTSLTPLSSTDNNPPMMFDTTSNSLTDHPNTTTLHLLVSQNPPLRLQQRDPDCHRTHAGTQRLHPRVPT
jgi:hypothetical protein